MLKSWAFVDLLYRIMNRKEPDKDAHVNEDGSKPEKHKLRFSPPALDEAEC